MTTNVALRRGLSAAGIMVAALMPLLLAGSASAYTYQDETYTGPTWDWNFGTGPGSGHCDGDWDQDDSACMFLSNYHGFGGGGFTNVGYNGYGNSIFGTMGYGWYGSMGYTTPYAIENYANFTSQPLGAQLGLF